MHMDDGVGRGEVHEARKKYGGGGGGNLYHFLTLFQRKLQRVLPKTIFTTVLPAYSQLSSIFL